MSPHASTLYQSPKLLISHDRENGWLEVCWIGVQTKRSVMLGCRLVIEFMIETKCYKILTDNTKVVKSWDHSVRYVAEEYFPALIKHGLVAFAGVTSADYFARSSTFKSLQQAQADIDKYVKLFSVNDRYQARQWLRSQP